MKKVLLILAICLSLIGCSKDSEEKSLEEEKEKVTFTYVQTIEVEGVCNENHTTINDEYEGSIDIYQNPSNLELVSFGSVNIKDISNRYTNWSEDSFAKKLYSYRVPYQIDFFAWIETNQNVLSVNEIKFEGISNYFPMSENDIEKPYLSTCQLIIIERKIDNPHEESE
jgi:hypothetical protein